jgi:crotonobetainyl-CoA:carnitine CoA-transferase CaiB-like acyl-CoA transferase
VSITGYGRDEPKGHWVAFGDDAGAAAGLCQVMRRATGDLQFLGDAIADPLTGIHAAVAAWRSWCSGGGRLIALALADTAAASLAEALRDCGPDGLNRSLVAWWNIVRARQPAPGPVRKAVGSVHVMGADTEAVLAEDNGSC